jgi:hypothetical protein
MKYSLLETTTYYSAFCQISKYPRNTVESPSISDDMLRDPAYAMFHVRKYHWLVYTLDEMPVTSKKSMQRCCFSLPQRILS